MKINLTLNFPGGAARSLMELEAIEQVPRKQDRVPREIFRSVKRGFASSSASKPRRRRRPRVTQPLSLPSRGHGQRGPRSCTCDVFIHVFATCNSLPLPEFFHIPLYRQGHRWTGPRRAVSTPNRDHNRLCDADINNRRTYVIYVPTDALWHSKCP